MTKRQIGFLEERNGTWHYRRRVPADVVPLLGLKWWKRSLATTDKRAAEIAARKLATEHDDVIAEARRRPAADKRAAKTLYLAQQYVGESERPGLAEWAEIALDSARAAPDDIPAAREAEKATSAAEKIRAAMIAAATQSLAALSDAERATVEEAGGLDAFFTRAMYAPHAVEVDRMFLGVRRNLGKVTARDAEAQEAALATRARYAAKDRATLVKLKLTDGEDHDDPKNPLIKTAMKLWFAARKQGPDAVRRHRVALHRFAELHGNVAVGVITRKMCLAYQACVENLPDHRKLPAKQRGGLADPGADVPRISSKTVDRHLSSLKAFLTFCVEQEWVAANVATGLHAKKDTRPKASKRRPFTREERQTLLAKAVEEGGENSDMAWLIRLGAYTGARLEELAQLARTNVRQVDGIWVVEIDDLEGRNVKTHGSVRMLPLHPDIRDDFVAWVQSGRGDRVFRTFPIGRDGRFTNKLSGACARLMDRAGLTDPRLVFHSLRHTMKRETSNARIDPDVRRALLGHAPKDAHDEYAGPSLEAIAEEFARLPPLF